MKKIYLLILCCLSLSGIIKAQVLSESFEEAGWVVGGTDVGGTVAGAIPTSSSAANTSWLYSAISVCSNTGTVTTLARSGKAVQVRTTGSSYIVTPIIKGGVASITVWVMPTSATTRFNIGIATSTNTTGVGQLSNSYSNTAGSGSTVSGIWSISYFSVGVNLTSGVWQQLSVTANVAATDDALVKFQRVSAGSVGIDDILISGGGPSAPVVTTTAPSSIGSTTATSGGDVTSDGGSAVLKKGVCWSTSANPKAYAPDTTVNGSGTGSFVSSITGLTAGTLYHVRAYAINAIDTAYGADLTFTTTIPTTDFYNVAGTDITIPGNWGTNTNGSGTPAANFTANGQVFHLLNTGGTMSGPLTITGTASKLIIENTFVATQTLNATTDVAAAGILTIKTATNPTFGTINTASTVNFDGAGTTASATNFGNLGLLNGGVLPVGSVGVFGTFNPGSTSSAVAGNNFSFNGTSAQTIPAFTFDSLIVNNTAGTSISGSSSVVAANKGISILQNLTIPAGDTLRPKGSNGVSYTVAASKALVVNGALDNQSTGTVTMTGTITVNSGGAYIMNAPVGNSAGFIPTGTYNAGSDIIVLQGAARIPATIGGNVTWSSTGAGSYLNGNTTIGGNMTVTNGQINHGSGGTGRSLTISGNLTVSGGRYDVLGTPGSGATNQTLTVNGNVNVTGGRLYASAGNTGTGTGTINIKGNLVHTSGSFGDSNIVNTTGLIVFNGTSNQNISSIGLSDTTSVTINNAAGVTLLTDFGPIGGTLTFTNGLIHTGANKLILDSMATTTGAGAGKYVHGNERKYFKTGSAISKTFEIGDATNYTPVDLTFASITGGGSITASTTAGDHPLVAISQLDGNLSVNRYWTLTNGGITFTTYDAVFNFIASDVDAGASTSSFIIGEYGLGGWTYPTVGTLTPTSSQLTGNTGFSDFAIAEVNALLPIKLEFINGIKSAAGNALNWKVNCTSTSITMQIERSANGTNFTTVNSITATQSRCSQPFDFMDAQPLAGTNYYRLKMIDIDGRISYSSIIAILNKAKGTEITGLYPSIIKNDATLSLVTAKAASMNTIITDMTGKLIKAATQKIAEGSSLIKVDCAGLPNGVYNLTGIIDGKVIKTIRFIKL
ncbi:hypothetical protein LK994_00230 [Ferruginibacter lapsinanis]|uniref:hypothetical protein n=1 Tax=Ferruginibacter lapsinanis TaxID=563172 RepID=UPI001E5E8BA6|nr:hypothetical protein [Ferruginibacter lapsinanis]UEG49898.1 hypothetical protein LK994_00230 [Ferruginibacter lapsinanis]